MDRPATAEDVCEICLSLPQVELGTSWGDRPTFKVGPIGQIQEKGKGFCLLRPAHPSATDPVTGEQWDDVLVIWVPDEATKLARVEAAGPFFTIDHFRNTNAVLLRLSRVGEISRDELEEVLIEAWAAKAPRSLAKKFFTERGLAG